MNVAKSACKLIACGALLSLITGCSSIMCGPRQDLTIKTKPAGAEVLVYNACGEIILQDTTPCILALERSDKDYHPASYVLLLRKEGYAPVQVPMVGSVNRAYFANVLNIVGFGIDPMTGSMWTLAPNPAETTKLDENLHTTYSHDKGLIVTFEEESHPEDVAPPAASNDTPAPAAASNATPAPAAATETAAATTPQ